MRTRLLLLALGFGVGVDAHAETGVDAQTYKPALDGGGVFSVEGADGLPQYDFGLRVGLGFTKAPLKLVVENVGNPGEKSNVIDSQLTLDVGISFGVTDRVTFALDVPIARQSLGAGYGRAGRYRPVDPMDESAYQPGTGFYSTRPDQNTVPSEAPPGDPRVSLKWRVWSSGPWTAAAQFILHVPFGDEDVFGGSQWFTYEPKLLLERRLGGKGFIALNAGARLREGTLAETRHVSADGYVRNDPVTHMPILQPLLYVGSEALVALGARYEITSAVSLGGEVYALIPIAKLEASECGEGCRNGDLTADALAGAYVAVTRETTVSLAGGLGLVGSAARADSFRVIGELIWTPKAGSVRAEAYGDRDGDGLADADDACPDDPEDKDGFQDSDGCSEPDNDLDGLADKADKCPNEPEDRDGYQDADGCPDTDDDGDGVPDVIDRCSHDPEDKDGFQDADGCPEADNDGDGIPDASDKCPNEPETVNGIEDSDGCPDQGGSTGPRLAQDRIDLAGEHVEFVARTAKLAPGAADVLQAVARVMLANPSARFRIEVGIELANEGRRGKEADLRVTLERARVVQAWLVEKGVKASQLDVAGLGSDRPLDAKKPKDPRLNRRVDFIRVNQ